jgi:hypothetical protein
MSNMTSFDTPTPDYSSLPPLSPIVGYDPVPAIDNVFRQTAHRALSVAIWLIVARIGLACWSRGVEFSFLVLPAALVCLLLAEMTSFMSFAVARHRRQCPREARNMALVAFGLMIPTLVWMFLPTLAVASGHVAAFVQRVLHLGLV